MRGSTEVQSAIQLLQDLLVIGVVHLDAGEDQVVEAAALVSQAQVLEEDPPEDADLPVKEAGDRSDSLLTINQPPRHGLVMALVVIVAPIDNVVPGTKGPRKSPQ